MKLTVLGTGTVAPSARRTAAAHWVSTGSVRILLDCGAGTLHRAATFGVPWSDVTHVALTHFHVDHWGELPMFLFALRWGVEPARSKRLHLIGPVGLAARLRHISEALGSWVMEPEFPLEIHELRPGDDFALGEDAVLESHKTEHTKESLAYAVRDSTARMVYTGDTGPSEPLADWAHACDLLLSECSLPDDRAIALHLTPTQAGRLAQRAEARRLVLTHLYPPVETVGPAAQAAAVFDGEVTVAEDGDRFTVGTGASEPET